MRPGERPRILADAGGVAAPEVGVVDEPQDEVVEVVFLREAASHRDQFGELGARVTARKNVMYPRADPGCCRSPVHLLHD